MANELTKVTDQNGVDHPFKDVSAFPRSEQAVLGAKNRYNFYLNGTPQGGTGITPTINDGVISLNGTASGIVYVVISETTIKNQFAGMKLTDGGLIPASLNDKVNLRMRIETDGGQFVRSEVVPTNGYIIIPALEANQRYRMDIAIADTADLESGITVKPMISFDGGEFVPFAMTNRELTEKVTRKFINSTEDIDNYYGADKEGEYYWNNAPSNSPESKNYCLLRVIHHPAQLDKQIVLWYTVLYIRERNSQGTWSAWFKYECAALS